LPKAVTANPPILKFFNPQILKFSNYFEVPAKAGEAVILLLPRGRFLINFQLFLYQGVDLI